jgi:hypothetical protein
MKLLRLAPAAALLGCALTAYADPLPPAGNVALEAFFDGCLDPVGARKDPGPALEHAIAGFKHETAPAPDPQHPERKLWKVRGVDGDVELETFTGKAWCEVRLLGADPDEAARKLNNALSRLDVAMQRKSLAGDAPGVTSEQVVLGHDSADAMAILVRKSREPKDGEPGLTLSAAPIRMGDQGAGASQ